MRATSIARRTASCSSPSTGQHHSRRERGEKEGPSSLGDQLQPLAEHPARRGRGHRLPRCADVCPVGADYEAMLADAHQDIPENTPAKEKRLAAMKGNSPATKKHKRFIGFLKPV